MVDSMIPSAKEIGSRNAAISSGRVFLGRRRVAYSDEFYTPPEIVKSLGSFDLDPCAGPMCHAKRNLRRNGLEARWFGRVWCNPLYFQLHEWLAKFVEHGNGCLLVNSRTETLWFQRLVASATAALFLRRPVKFLRPKLKPASPPCGSVLVAIGESNRRALIRSGLDGFLWLPRGKS